MSGKGESRSSKISDFKNKMSVLHEVIVLASRTSGCRRWRNSLMSQILFID